jgi:excisionase family DNA binding protein
MKTRSKNSGMLTTTEVADALHVHPNTVRQWANKRLIRAYRLGPRGDRRFKREDLEGFLRQNDFGFRQLL